MINRETYEKRMKVILGDTITLTPCQDKVMRTVWEFAHDVDKRTMLIKGPAGCGKTYCVQLIKKLLPEMAISVTAPTHKALKAVSDVTNIEAATYHKLLGLRPNYKVEEFDTDNLVFDQQAPPAIGMYNIVIGDEASMVNSMLFDYTLKEAKHNNTKIIFVGDVFQLPPINKKNPEITAKAFIEGAVDVMVNMFTPVRQAMESSLFLLLSALRSDISTLDQDYEIFRKVANQYEGGGIIRAANNESMRGSHFGWFLNNIEFLGEADNGFDIYYNKLDFVQDTVKAFKNPQFQSDSSYCKFISYTNDSVVAWNKFIRDKLLNTPEFITEGDLMMGYNTVYSADNNQVITNSNEYRVVNCFPNTRKVTIKKGMQFHDVVVDTVTVVLKSELSEDKVRVDIVHPPYDKFAEVHEYFHRQGTEKGRWPQYYTWKNGLLCVGKLPKIRRLAKIKKDLDFGYGITAHKSQGSTFEYVFVDLKDILSHTKGAAWRLKKAGKLNKRTLAEAEAVTKRLAYVAISRASKHASIYYELV